MFGARRAVAGAARIGIVAAGTSNIPAAREAERKNAAWLGEDVESVKKLAPTME